MLEKEEKSFSRAVMILLFVVCVLLFATLCTGCTGTLYGFCSDTEAGSGAIRRWLKPGMEKREEAMLIRARKEQEAKVQKAADLVLAERRK